MLILLTEILTAWKPHLSKASNGCACYLRDMILIFSCAFSLIKQFCVLPVSAEKECTT